MAYADTTSNGIAARANAIAVYKLDETTGLTGALDFLGNSNLTASSTPPISTSGKITTSRLFAPANNTYLEIAAPGAPLAVGSGVRFERIWIYITGTAAGVIAGRWNDTGPIHEEVWYVDTDNSLRCFVSANGNSFANASTPPGTITRDAWNFIERRISSDGISGIAVCVNRGTEYGVAFTGPVFSGTNPFRIGQTTDGASKFAGAMCQYELFSAVPSDAVRDYVYNAGVGRDVWEGTTPGGLTAGILSAPTGATTTSITGMVCTAATGNTGTVTRQLQSRLTSGVTADYADVTGQTSSPFSLTPITPSTSPASRTFRVRDTDNNGSVYSNEVTGIPLAYTTVTGTGTATGDPFNLIIPAGMANGTGAPLAAVKHGLGGTQDQQLSDADGLLLIGVLVRSGCRVVTPLSGGTAGWNSPTAIAAAIDATDTAANGVYNTTGIFEVGISMGGGQSTTISLQAAATAFATPGAAIKVAGKPLFGLVTYAAAVNRTWLVANGFGTSITNAGSTFDPVAVVAANGNALRGLPLAQLYNGTDPTVDSNANSITLRNDLTDGGSHTTFVDSVNSAHVGDGLFTTQGLDFVGNFVTVHRTPIIALADPGTPDTDPLAAGTLTGPTGTAARSLTGFTATAPTGGTPPYVLTPQFRRTTGGTYADAPGSGGAFSLTGILSPSTGYTVRQKQADSAGGVVYTNEQTATTSGGTTAPASGESSMASPISGVKPCVLDRNVESPSSVCGIRLYAAGTVSFKQRNGLDDTVTVAGPQDLQVQVKRVYSAGTDLTADQIGILYSTGLL